MSTKVHVGASKLHKWLALIIGIQVLLWVVSGSVMSILPIETVRSEHLVSREPASIGSIDTLIPPAEIASKLGGNIQSLRYRMLMGKPLAEAIGKDGAVHLFDAASGKRRDNISAGEARTIVKSAWLDGEPEFDTVRKIETDSVEYRGKLPAWQVTTPDDVRVYIPVATGEIAAVRSPTWRFYDFFWSLHIMDWKNHQNFNSWWLIAFALGGVFMAISGLTLLVKRWPIGRRKRNGTTQQI